MLLISKHPTCSSAAAQQHTVGSRLFQLRCRRCTQAASYLGIGTQAVATWLVCSSDWSALTGLQAGMSTGGTGSMWAAVAVGQMRVSCLSRPLLLVSLPQEQPLQEP